MAKRALLLISDTGGGHRSAANAIAAALQETASYDTFETRIEDVAAHCAFRQTGMQRRKVGGKPRDLMKILLCVKSQIFLRQFAR